MRSALDESGSFPLAATGPVPPVSVAVAVVVPDDEWGGLLASYRSFRRALTPGELRDGEPKGGRLLPASKHAYCELLDRHPRVQVCPCIIDLGHFPDDNAAALRDQLSRDVARIADCSVDADRERLRTISARIARLSPNQSLRLFTWGRAFFYGLYHSILTPDVGDTLTEWDNREFYIDPVQDAAGSDEEAVFAETLPLWMAGWSTIAPFVLLDEADFPRNSFRSRFSHEDRVDLDAVLSGRVRFDRTSKVEELLQIADIAASIVYQAARSPAAGAEVLAVYERLMFACPYEPGFGIGLVTPHRRLVGSGRPNRFEALFAAMDRARRATWKSHVLS